VEKSRSRKSFIENNRLAARHCAEVCLYEFAWRIYICLIDFFPREVNPGQEGPALDLP
jgi:hypothetical protein